MSKINYSIYQLPTSTISEYEDYSNVDKLAMDSFELYSSFNPFIDKVELHIYSLDGERLISKVDHKNFAISEANNKGGISLTLGPIKDLTDNDYEYGGVRLLYNFVSNLYANDSQNKDFIIHDISGDRKELKLASRNIDKDTVRTVTEDLKKRLKSESDFSEFRVNLGNNDLLIGVNIDILEEEDTYIVVKLHTPLPNSYTKNTLVQIQSLVNDSIVYEIETELITDELKIPQLKGPNFNIEVEKDSNNDSEYFNFNELSSFPVNNTYRQIASLAKKKNIQITVDYSDFGEFVQFGSAVERLENFKYKLDLITNYQTNLDAVEATSNNESGISGSREYYHSKINEILENFDHYDNFLFYESGSHSWPKTNSTKPYTVAVTGAATGSWYLDKINSASLFDYSNYSSLTNSIPSYLSDDPNNAPYTLFTQMVGQHFDNIWIYSKAVTDKYDGDNREDRGIPKELVETALRNFGVKLYTSNKSTQDLFKMFTGDFYNTGSEDINTFVSASNQPTSEDGYRKQVFKRIYHNLPLLLKSKGTERGLRVLMNCFGINNLNTSGSHNGLLVKQEGGWNREGTGNMGPSTYVTSSLGKVRFDNTGSIVSGNTLSQLTSIVSRDQKYTEEIPSVEVGYSPTDDINNYILANSASINIDDYIGDPGDAFYTNYPTLDNKADDALKALNSYDLQDLTRILKFFDNVIFKMIKDFTPARSNVSTGVIVKPHILSRPKAKLVSASIDENRMYSQSIEIGEYSADFAFGESSIKAITSSYTETVQSPVGPVVRDYHNYEVAQYDGELSGSIITAATSELNDENTFKDANNFMLYKQDHVNADIDCTVVFFLT